MLVAKDVSIEPAEYYTCCDVSGVDLRVGGQRTMELRSEDALLLNYAYSTSRDVIWYSETERFHSCSEIKKFKLAILFPSRPG